MQTTQIPYLLQGYDAERTTFLNQVRGVLGKNAIAMYLPHRNDTTTSICPVSARVWTADATMVGQITPLGKGSARVFNGTTNYLTTPDTTDLSFGNSTTDTPMTFFAVINVTDTAAARRIFAKIVAANTGGEYHFSVSAADALLLLAYDSSANASAFVASNATITQGAWTTLAGTYSAATGGATAANDMTLYQLGTVFASTATNNASYVAMENGTQLGAIAAASDPTASMPGSIAMLMVVGANVTAAQHLGLTNVARNYFQF